MEKVNFNYSMKKVPLSANEFDLAKEFYFQTRKFHKK